MRKLGIVLIVVLLAGALAMPAADARAKACKKFKPGEPQSTSSQKTEATEAPVLKLTDKATEAKPVTAEFSHGPGLQLTSDSPAVLEDSAFFNVQLESKAAAASVNFRVEWGSPSPSDIDLYVYDGEGGALIDQSTSYNPQGGDDDGMGFEQISGLGFDRCDGITIESRVSSSASESMTLKVWLD